MPTAKKSKTAKRSPTAANDAAAVEKTHTGDGEEAESEEEYTTEEFEVELDDGSAWTMNFYDCAAEGDVTFLKQILDDKKVDVNNVDVDGFTALMLAAAEGHREVVMELLRRGADVSFRTHELRSTALHFAAKNDDAEVMDAICRKDQRLVDCWNINAETPLIWACIEGCAESVRVLLSYNADVNVVNQNGSSTLICSVMIGEDPEEDESDGARSEIIKMLLAKNPKLVNFQDREGSTAMHLAASCGYLECVKTLLAYGADITLRNAIGQTPLEEAEQTGLVESDVCVDHLRLIWQNLEEEAAARMMTMLEMEEQSARDRSNTATNKSGVSSSSNNNNNSNSNSNSNSSSSTSAKKNKKKNKKAKRKAAKQQTPPADDAGTTFSLGDDKNAESRDDSASSGESSDEEEHESKKDMGEQEEESTQVDAEETEATHLPDDGAAVSGVWTTVGKKHKTAPSATVQDDAGSPTDGDSTVIDSATGGRPSRSPASKIVPFNSRRKQKQRNEASVPAAIAAAPSATRPGNALSSTKTAASISSRNDAPSSRGSSSRAPFSRLASHATGGFTTTQSPLPYSATPIFSSSSSSLYSSAFSSSNGAKAQERVRSHLNVSASPWRTGFGSSSSYGSGVSSGAMAASPYASGNRSLWKHSQRVSVNQLAVEAKEKWVSRLRLANENVSEAIGYLACGICGELVNENLQCNVSVNGTGCTQLYCGTCLAKTLATTAGGASLKCVKCHQLLNHDEMRPNHFAQAQAASLGLSSSSASSSNNTNVQDAESYFTMEEMQHTLENSIPHAAIVDLNPFHLTPGSDLSVLSNGQLEILEQAHQLALTQIMEMRIANARIQERLQIEEWMKTQRDILHFAAMTNAAATADASSSQAEQVSSPNQ